VAAAAPQVRHGYWHLLRVCAMRHAHASRNSHCFVTVVFAAASSIGKAVSGAKVAVGALWDALGAGARVPHCRILYVSSRQWW